MKDFKKCTTLNLFSDSKNLSTKQLKFQPDIWLLVWNIPNQISEIDTNLLMLKLYVKNLTYWHKSINVKVVCD